MGLAGEIYGLDFPGKLVGVARYIAEMREGLRNNSLQPKFNSSLVDGFVISVLSPFTPFSWRGSVWRTAVCVVLWRCGVFLWHSERCFVLVGLER